MTVAIVVLLVFVAFVLLAIYGTLVRIADAVAPRLRAVEGGGGHSDPGPAFPFPEITAHRKGRDQ